MTILAYVKNPVLNIFLGSLPRFDEGAWSVKVLSGILRTFINLAFIIGTIAFIFMLLFGGYEYIISGGEKEAVQKAAKRITHALIGLAILFSVYAILAVIEIVFGINFTLFNIPTIS